MPIAKFWGENGSRVPFEFTLDKETPSTQSIPSSKAHAVGGKILDRPMTKLEVLCTVEVPDRLAANQLNVSFRKNGIPWDMLPRVDEKGAHHRNPPAPGRVWRFRGFPEFLRTTAARFRCPSSYSERLLGEPSIRTLADALGQLSGRMVQAVGRNGAKLPAAELAIAETVLDNCEREVAVLHILAATAANVLDDARMVYGLPPAMRSFAVMCEYDPLPESNGHSEQTKVEKGASK